MRGNPFMSAQSAVVPIKGRAVGFSDGKVLKRKIYLVLVTQCVLQVQVLFTLTCDKWFQLN